MSPAISCVPGWRPWYTGTQYTIVAHCDGVHGVLYTRGGKWNPRRSRGCHFPSRVYKTHGPHSQRATTVLLYLCIIVIPLLEVLLSSSNIITTDYSLFNKQTNKKQFLEPAVISYTARNRPMLGTIKVMYTGVHHFSCYPARHEPCNMRFFCASHDWFSTNQTSQFVTEV